MGVMNDSNYFPDSKGEDLLAGRINSLLHLYEALSQVTIEVINSSTIGELFQSVCDSMVLSGEFNLIWIGTLGEDNVSVLPRARAGRDLGYIDSIKTDITQGTKGRGPSARSIRNQVTTVVNDVASDMKMRAWRREAQQNNLASLVTLPIMVDRNNRGTLAVYSPIVGYFDESKVEILERIAKIISLKWNSFVEETKAGVENDLITSKERTLAMAITHSPMGICLLDQDGKVVVANDSICQILGRNQQELIGIRAALFIEESERSLAMAQWYEIMNQPSSTTTNNLRLVHKDGSKRWVRVQLSVPNPEDSKYLLLQIEDIHEAHLEQELQQNFGLNMEKLLANAPVALLATDSDGVVTMNAGGLASARPEFSFFKIAKGNTLALESQSDGANEVVRLLENKASFDGSVQIHETQIDLHIQAQSGRDGSIEQLMAIAIDTTEMFQAKTRLALKAATSQALLELGQRLMIAQDSQSAIDEAIAVLKNACGARFVLFAPILEDSGILVGATHQDAEPFTIRVNVRRNTAVAQSLDAVKVALLRGAEMLGGFEISAISQQFIEVAVLPVMGRNQILGAIIIVPRNDVTVRQDNLEFLNGVMTSLNTTIQRTELEHAHLNQARLDRLTGLWNRDSYREALAIALEENYNSSSGGLLVATLDVDRFRQINEALGHEVGDKVVFKIADVLRTCVVDGCTIARIGGDEFGIFVSLARETLQKDAQAILDGILDDITYPMQFSSVRLLISASIGATIVPCGSIPDQKKTLSQVDMAMYDAKSSQVRVKFYVPKPNDPTTETLMLLSDLTEAIDNGEIEVYLQPKMAIKTSKITGFEALARWKHRVRGFVAPDQFIRLAEQTGQIRTLTETVLEKSIYQIQTLCALGYCLPIAVNLSPSLFTDETIAETIETMLRAGNVPFPFLELEFTETMSLADPDNALRVFRRLSEQNFRFSIDDFGTGFSSLNHLRNVAASAIKIDKSYIENITTSEKDFSIVKGVIELGHALSFSVVAEGVEDKETLKSLDNLGCDEIQGFLLGYPMPLNDLLTWLDQNTYSDCGMTFHKDLKP
ncbi:phytochrome-like protein cph2 [Acidithrix ferrooxidans]|uniref:Phytochrome-like protein cph2 n=4 Tax=root TaxID=1 RepID=A0A0D8HE93_9ACTN|nr:phytochrome-like protein cph2 [Acidithrix ferrooxidans]